MKETKKIGIFGGTFNPIHNTHLYLADEFLKQMKLDYCYIVPTYISPFKIGNKSEQLYPENRLKMLELAIKNNPKFKIESFELNKKKISYTIDTVKYFKSNFPNDKIFLLIGSDQAMKFNRWKQWQMIIDSVQLCIVKRDDDFDSIQQINKLFPITHKPKWLEIKTTNLSSSQIREMIKLGKSISELVPNEVEKYIQENKLYL